MSYFDMNCNWHYQILLLVCSWCCVCIAHQQVQFGQPQQQQHMHAAPQHGQVQHGQVPHGGGPGQGQPVFGKNQVHDREHIKEHLEGVIQQPDTSKMSDQELQFHYFKMHDYDNNNKLDGAELIKSLIHWHEADNEHVDVTKTPTEHKILTDDELAAMLDGILTQDDTNNDGYIDWAEFIAAQQRN